MIAEHGIETMGMDLISWDDCHGKAELSSYRFSAGKYDRLEA